MGRTQGSINAALPRLIGMCVENDNKTVDEVAVELNITNTMVIAKAKHYLCERDKKLKEKKLKQEDKVKKIDPLPIQKSDKIIYSGKIEVIVSMSEDKYSVIKTDSMQIKTDYPKDMLLLDCIIQVLKKLILQVNPGTEIKLTIIPLNKLLEKIKSERLFTELITDSEIICYSLYKTVCDLYKIVIVI
jgi:hypothetical protein